MAEKKYILKLTQDERLGLESLVRRGYCAGWKIRRAQALLAMDASEAGPGWIDAQVAQAYACTVRAVEMWRKQAVEEGPLSLLSHKQRPVQVGKLDGDGQARLVALACSDPPEGYGRWNLRLLAGRLVELEVVDSISYETVRQGLKKTILNRGAR